MFMMKGALALFISLAIGYVLCILASKQKKGILQTVGYSLGTAIIILSFLYSVADSSMMMSKKSKMWRADKSMKCRPGTFMRGRIK